MHVLKKAALLILTAGTALSSLVPYASASYTGVHKVTENGVTAVYIPGTANTQVQVKTPKLPTASLLTLNACGWGKLSNSTTSPILNITGGSTNFGAKTSAAPPVCVKQADGTNFDSNSAATVGTVIDAGTQIWIKGGSGIGTLAVDVTKQAVINSTINACGFSKLAVNATRPLTTFMVGATNYTLSSVTSMPASQICKNTTLYRPVTAGS